MNTPAIDLGLLRGFLSRSPAAWEPTLAATWAEPDLYGAATFAELGRVTGAPLKSSWGGPIDAFHDLVVRHLGQQRICFLEQRGTEQRTLSFDELHRRACLLEAGWAATGIEAGARVALVLPPGPLLLVALVAALKRGLVVAVVPPRGDDFVRARLEALAPNGVVYGARYEGRLGDFEKLRWSLDASGPAEPLGSHGYAVDEPVLKLFSPLAEDPLAATELTAGTLFSRLTSDALLPGLARGEALAPVELDSLQVQPWAALLSLLAGGCLAAMDLEAALTPRWPKGVTGGWLGLGPQLRDRVLAGARPVGWRAWFRDPTVAFEWEPWHRFVTLDRMPPGLDLVPLAASGGVLAFGPIHPARPFMMWPAPGLAFELSSFEGAGPALGDVGLLAVEGLEAALGKLVFAAKGAALQWVGHGYENRSGRVYPAQEVARVVERLDGVDGAVAILVPSRARLNDARAVLVVFGAQLPTDAMIEATISEALDSSWVPDEIRSSPLCPRRGEDGVDATWCRFELQRGSLASKANDRLFMALSELRRAAGGRR